jgi:hypothetical protein
MQLRVIFTTSNNIEIMAGKLRTGISMLLFCAREAIADNMLSDEENP